MRRRSFLAAAAAPIILSGCKTVTGNLANIDVRRQLADLERAFGGRLGVGILDTSTGKLTGHRMDERFGMCSTFKLPLAAVILHEISEERLAEDQWVPITKADMVPYAPVTGKALKDSRGGMTVLDLARAAQKTSDNVAANLLLKLIGGPEGFTQKLRAFGDETTRLDRMEPEMNLVPSGEIRDTTTPAAMARLAGDIFAGHMLSSIYRDMLKRWALDTRTGLKRIRAGLPSDWVAGDKTGTGIHESMANKHNDVAIVWPPGRSKPIIVAAYYEAPDHYPKMRPQDDAVLAEVGQIVAELVTWLPQAATRMSWAE